MIRRLAKHGARVIIGLSWTQALRFIGGELSVVPARLLS